MIRNKSFRHRIPVSMLVLGLTLMSLAAASSVLAQAVTMDPLDQPRFETNLPIPGRLDFSNFDRALNRFTMEEVQQHLGLFAADGTPLMTTVWGYGMKRRDGFFAPVSYPGPTIVAMRDVPLDIQWQNNLPMYNYPDGPGAHLLPVDPTLHMAHSMRGGIPTVAHLHGGHTESASDGLPEAWYTQNFRERGPFFVKRNYHYDNDQEAATLWYHDHALGITRLNVYAGLAGFYLLRDQNEMGLINGGVLPGGPYEIEIVIQDRMFTPDGQLYFPSDVTDAEFATGPEFEPFPPNTPTAVAEFFGDHILVNGAAWPKLDVEPRKYRFRLLNGSDSRFYVLQLDNGESFMQIGTDDGLLETPVAMDQLLLAPGERIDVVVDFSGIEAGTQIVMQNFGPDEPFKGFDVAQDPADPATTGQIMAFNVSLPLDAAVADASVDYTTTLRPAIEPLVQNGATRQLVLFEGLDNYGRLQPLLGTMDQGSLAWFEPITENPMLNDVEVWEVYNSTEDAHPIHLHLVGFQILSRESFTGFVTEKPQEMHDGSFGVGGILSGVVLGGDARDPEPNEMGWKDTAVMLPGEVTRVIARFDREGRYVWHCHILSHEDHEMMRPYQVGPIPQPKKSKGDVVAAAQLSDIQLSPNPFNPKTNVNFRLGAAAPVELAIYDVRGRLVRSFAAETYAAGAHAIEWDGRGDRGESLPSGNYLFRLQAGADTHTGKMTLAK